MATINIRLIVESLVEFGVSNPRSSSGDASQHIQTAFGWGSVNAGGFIDAVTLRMAQAGRTEGNSWADTISAWGIDGRETSIQWVDRFVDTEEFRRQSSIRLLVLRERVRNAAPMVTDKDDKITVAQDLKLRLTNDAEIEIVDIAIRLLTASKLLIDRESQRIDEEIRSIEASV